MVLQQTEPAPEILKTAYDALILLVTESVSKYL